MSENSKLTKVGESYRVDADTGEMVPIEGGGFRMLPTAPGTCEWCGAAHRPEEPHNQESLTYQMKFHAIHGRWPTWTDAMAHMTPEARAQWKEVLTNVLLNRGKEVPEDLRTT